MKDKYRSLAVHCGLVLFIDLPSIHSVVPKEPHPNEALRQGKGRSDGLRQAQLGMLRSKDRQHPFYWGAFIQSGGMGQS